MEGKGGEVHKKSDFRSSFKNKSWILDHGIRGRSVTKSWNLDHGIVEGKREEV